MTTYRLYSSLASGSETNPFVTTSGNGLGGGGTLLFLDPLLPGGLDVPLAASTAALAKPWRANPGVIIAALGKVFSLSSSEDTAVEGTIS